MLASHGHLAKNILIGMIGQSVIACHLCDTWAIPGLKWQLKVPLAACGTPWTAKASAVRARTASIAGTTDDSRNILSQKGRTRIIESSSSVNFSAFGLKEYLC